MTDTRPTATRINSVSYATPHPAMTSDRVTSVLESPDFAQRVSESRALLAGIRRERENEVTYQPEDPANALPPRWRRPDFIIPVAIAALATVFGVAALLGATVGDGGGDGGRDTPSGVVETSAQPAPTPRGTNQPLTLEAARAAAQTGWDRFTANDYAGTYDTYGSAVRKLISRADYAELFRACNEALGTADRLAVTVEDPRWETEPGGAVIVTVRHPLTTATRVMIYEDGRWVQRPQPETLRLIAAFARDGLDDAVTRNCRG